MARAAKRRGRRCALFEWDTRLLGERSASATVVFTTPVFAVTENVGKAIIRVDRKGPSSGFAMVNIETVDGTATAPADYAAKQRVLRFEPGETFKRLAVPIVNDTLKEQIETLEVRLSAASGVALGPLDHADVAIQDDDIEQTPLEVTDSNRASQPAIVSFSPDGRNEASEVQLLVWVEIQGGIPKVLGQFFNSEGQPLGPPFLVSLSGGGQGAPDVSVDGAGNFVVVWRGGLGRGATSDGVFGRFFSNLGKPLTPDLMITGELLAGTVKPQVSSSNDGEVVVLWERDGGVEGLQVGADGVPSGLPFEIPLGQKPKVATSATGTSIVVWEQSALPRGASAGGVFGQFVLPGGKPIGDPLPIALGSEAENPAVATNDEGDFVVVWQEGLLGEKTVKARLFDRGGQAKSEAFDVSLGSGDQVNASVDMNSVGDFAVTWESKGNGISDVLTGLFNRSGKKIGEPITVASGANGLVPTAPDVTLEDDDDVRVVFDHDGSKGVLSQRLDPAMTARCRKGSESLCLDDRRFEVRVSWRAPAGATGQGEAKRLTEDTGFFWFFSPDNVELVVKVLDGCGVNDRFWVFAGGLTDVETNIVVTDTLTGQSRSYATPRGQAFQPIQDVNAFRSCQAKVAATAVADSSEAETESALGHAAASPTSPEVKGAKTCTADSTSFCLNQQRFQVAVDWQTAQATSGEGMAIPLSVDTGYFWFFSPDNVELIVKVLDGCAINDRFWVFAGGLTDVAATLRITDTESGVTRVYDNPQGQPFLPIQDTDAFAQCP